MLDNGRLSVWFHDIYIIIYVNITLHDLFSYVFSENEWAFDLLYCVAFLVMDKQWLERNATYMEFNVRNHAFF